MLNWLRNKMGGKQSTEESEPEEEEVVSRPRSERKVSLLVLHNEPEFPEMKFFCRVLNSDRKINITMPPQLNKQNNSDDKEDFMFSVVPDGGQFPNDKKDAIVAWIKKQIKRKKHVTLLCLLTECNLESLREGTGLENDNRIIPFCFEQPQVNHEDHVICIKVDFKRAVSEDYAEGEKLQELVTAILDENIVF
ncbi:uncharacterized protein LOC114526351 [Dendronephthya gigantea]|uniref:uncharacterized protein LOC114526351 n=1 Tax=Dendronephthya gigantea TaxID=151771 RepID=UPI00106A382D|nr:uncharacterized protein LOC114526351 [Dendronephthya gigantea]